MALLNLVKMTTATQGTGTLTLGSAVSGFLTMAQAGAVNGTTYSYGITDGVNSETGRGVYTAVGTTFTRVVSKSTNSNNAINLSGGAVFFITPVADDFPSAFGATLIDDATASDALTTLGVSAFAKTILDDANATNLLATLGIVSSVYNPTFTGITNIDSVTGTTQTQYYRIGSFVIIIGFAAVATTAAASTASEFEMSLPVASDFTGTTQCLGICTSGIGEFVQITGDITTNRVQFAFLAGGTAARNFNFVVGYQIA